MRYYLSYIERNGHAALMLSDQASDNEPVKVTCELGFALSLDVAEVNYFGTYKGRVGEETNAARALYSSTSDVQHRTYEISKAEMEKFFQILNKDRKINADKIKPSDSMQVIKYEGGPDYQKLSHNCKGYALGIFKELGIIEADALSNFFIQRPHTHTELLQPLSAKVLSCPIKEELDEKIISLLERINKETKSIITDDKAASGAIPNIIKIKQISDMLLKNMQKLGIKSELNKHFKEISSLLDTLGIQTFKEELTEVEKMAIAVTKLSGEGALPIQWKPNLPVAKRLKLDNFTPEEKAIYIAKIKTNETSDGLEQVLSDIDERMKKIRSFERDFYLDLFDLKTMIKEAKSAVDQSNQIFLKSIENQEPADVMEACAQQRKAIDEITGNLEQKVNEFKPRSEEASFFMRFINRIISYFKKDFITVDTTQNLMKDSIQSLKQSDELWNTETEEENNGFQM